eukprot:2136200-Amphidinium_carterae.1
MQKRNQNMNNIGNSTSRGWHGTTKQSLGIWAAEPALTSSFIFAHLQMMMMMMMTMMLMMTCGTFLMSQTLLRGALQAEHANLEAGVHDLAIMLTQLE